MRTLRRDRPGVPIYLHVSDGSSLREDSDRQGVALDDCESGTGSCDGLKETAVLGSCDADSLEATPTRPRSALKVRSLPHASPPQKQVGAQLINAPPRTGAELRGRGSL